MAKAKKPQSQPMPPQRMLSQVTKGEMMKIIMHLRGDLYEMCLLLEDADTTKKEHKPFRPKKDRIRYRKDMWKWLSTPESGATIYDGQAVRRLDAAVRRQEKARKAKKLG